MEVAPFFVDFHHFLSIFTIFCRFSRFTHFCRDLHFVAIYALFPPIFFGQNSHPRHKSPFFHVWLMVVLGVLGVLLMVVLLVRTPSELLICCWLSMNKKFYCRQVKRSDSPYLQSVSILARCSVTLTLIHSEAFTVFPEMFNCIQN